MELSGGGFPLKQEGAVKFYPVHTNAAGFPVNGERKSFAIDNGGQKTFATGRDGMPVHETASDGNADAERAKLRKAAEGFEAIFIRQFLKTMNSTIPGGGMFGSGTEGEMYGDITENALAETLAGRSGFGIADALYRQLSVRLGAEPSGTGTQAVENITKAGEER